MSISLLAMATENPSAILPTLERLGVSAVPADVDARKVAQLWLDSFAKYAQSGDIDGVLSLFSPDAWWRDMLAFTWAFRTFHSAPKIRKFLEDGSQTTTVFWDEVMKIRTDTWTAESGFE